jgi:cell wall-associated NlpC family hydrolase
MKKIIISSIIGANLLFSGVALAAPASNQYIATDDDTFWTISQKINVNLSDLMSANPQVDSQNIYAGLVIKIPGSKPVQQLSWEQKADAIIATGMTQLGTPYVFGGDTPYTAFDCSGFTQYAFGKNGINLPHSSAMQSQLGRTVAKGDLRKGDLIFLQGTYTTGVSHVAIYLGDNKVLHASTSGTREVKISTLFGSPYYDAHYWGARRIIN